MGTVEPHTLVAAAERILVTAGASPANALTVAASFVGSDLVGHNSPGVRRLVPYLETTSEGRLDPAVEPILGRARSAASVMDSRRGFGQVAARPAVIAARRLCHEHSAGVVAIRRCNHVGRIEAVTRAEFLRDGLSLSDVTWRDLAALPGGPGPHPEEHDE